MTGESNYFRKSFIGGFNREDVVDYITELARERNELAEAKAKAESDVQRLTHEIEILHAETEQTKRKLEEEYTQKSSVLRAAGYIFSEFEAEFNAMRIEMEAAASGVFAELEKARGSVSKIPTILKQVRERFDGLRAEFDKDKSEEVEEEY